MRPIAVDRVGRTGAPRELVKRSVLGVSDLVAAVFPPEPLTRVWLTRPCVPISSYLFSPLFRTRPNGHGHTLSRNRQSIAASYTPLSRSFFLTPSLYVHARLAHMSVFLGLLVPPFPFFPQSYAFAPRPA